MSRYINSAISRPTKSWGAKCPWPDTSKATVAPKTPRTPRVRIPATPFHPIVRGKHMQAPEGYGFDGRGDLRKLSRLPQEATRAA